MVNVKSFLEDAKNLSGKWLVTADIFYSKWINR